MSCKSTGPKPCMSIAAVAGAHGMRANVLHRWLKEHARTGAASAIVSTALRAATYVDAWPVRRTRRLGFNRGGQYWIGANTIGEKS